MATPLLYFVVGCAAEMLSRTHAGVSSVFGVSWRWGGGGEGDGRGW